MYPSCPDGSCLSGYSSMQIEKYYEVQSYRTGSFSGASQPLYRLRGAGGKTGDLPRKKYRPVQGAAFARRKNIYTAPVQSGEKDPF